MREIKFRGKRKDNGEWVYGDLIQCNQHRHILIPTDKHLHLVIKSEPNDIPMEAVPVIPETVGQFTGLKDKNGKDDWINDIVKVKVGQIAYCRQIFQADSGAYCIKLPVRGATGGENGIMLITIEYENVGNKWENPELLEIK